jgi:hypothetical protein
VESTFTSLNSSGLSIQRPKDAAPGDIRQIGFAFQSILESPDPEVRPSLDLDDGVPIPHVIPEVRSYLVAHSS